MGKRILFIGGNFAPEPIGIGKYNGEMIEWLSNEGYDCSVITTFPYYPQWKVQYPVRKRAFWYKKEISYNSDKFANSFRVTRCPHYVPKKPTGLSRMISEFTFFFTSAFIVIGMLFKKKYDFVFIVAPPFHLGLLGILYKKCKGAKFLYHIQDLQIEVAQNLQIIKSRTLLKTLFWVERYILKNADFISTICNGMINRVKYKCGREINFLPNWVDIKKFYPIAEKANLKSDFNFKTQDKIVLYSGAIGEKQGIEEILQSAKYFENVLDLKFVICGSGPYKEILLLLTKQMNLQNVVFLPLQPFEKLNALLNIADVHLVLQKNGAADLVMPSKLSTILAVGGVSIVTANPGSSLFNIIESNNAGLLIEPENQDALNSAIKYAISNEHREIEVNARHYAEGHLSIHKILSALTQKILEDNNNNLIPIPAQQALSSIA